MSKAKIFQLSVWQVVQTTTLLIPLLIVSFGLVALTLLLANSLTSTLVFPLGFLAMAVTTIIFVRSYRPPEVISKERKVCDVLVLLFILSWIAGNAFFTAQHVFTNRDPGTYTITALHLVERDNLQLDSQHPFGNTPGVDGSSGGFSINPRDSSEVASQGAHLLPALLGVSGRVNTQLIFRLNVLFGGLALLAVYAFGVQLMKPKWALAAVLTLGLVFPLMYFSRDTYTEPLTMVFTFGGLALLNIAYRAHKSWLWFLAGLTLAATVLTRIDGYLIIAGVLTATFVYLAAQKSANRKRAIRQTLALITGIAVTAVVGFLDIYYLSYSYFLSEWGNIKPELVLIGLILVLGIASTAIIWRNNSTRDGLNSFAQKYGVIIFVGLLFVASIGLASRPFWHTGLADKPVFNVETNSVEQVAQRDYSEITVNWLTWYLGPMAILLSVAGLGLIFREIIVGKKVSFLPFVVVFAATSLLYLVNPSIFPDQIWASRRFLPVVMPGIALLAAFALNSLYEKNRKIFGLSSRSVSLVLVPILVLGPLWVTRPLLLTRESTWSGAIENVCTTAENQQNPTILWLGTARNKLVEPTKAICNIAAAGYGQVFGGVKSITPEVLAEAGQAARQNGYIPLVGFFGSEATDVFVQPTNGMSEIPLAYELIEQTHTNPPRTTRQITDTIQLGVIAVDGTIRPLE